MMNSNLIEQAKRCKDCVNWVKNCKAECCKIIKLNVPKEEIHSCKTTYFNFLKNDLTIDAKRYFSYHDVPYTRGVLRFKRERCFVSGEDVFYIFPCKMLNEQSLCSVHETTKPDICKEFEFSNCSEKKFHLPETCLFRYKLEGGKKHDKEKNKKD